MTNEEVIENLKYLISDDCTDTQHDFVKEIKIAIEALEKQVPKKAPNHDGMVCPSCNSKARYGHPYEYYCPHCGQAIDWSDNE